MGARLQIRGGGVNEENWDNYNQREKLAWSKGETK